MNTAVEIVAAVCFIDFILVIVAFGQLTGKRRETSARYFVLVLLAAWVLFDWLSGATGWVMVEGIALMVAVPIGFVHLTVLLVQESRDSRGIGS